MTALFTVDCTCGRKVVIDSDTMRRVDPLACAKNGCITRVDSPDDLYCRAHEIPEDAA